ncbi:MAG: hypothetical protein QHI48_11050 [Bacteroidota bacterium]|nr:hypothetical protein [Bacteroidota bacterium]
MTVPKLLPVALLACIVSCTDVAAQSAVGDSTEIVFRVTSAGQETEAIFRAAILYTDMDTTLVCREAQTPAEFIGKGVLCIGLFERTGGGELRVVMLVRNRGGERTLAEAVGNVVIVEKRYGEHTALSF